MTIEITISGGDVYTVRNVRIAYVDDVGDIYCIDERGYAEYQGKVDHRSEIQPIVEKYLDRRLTHPAHPRYIDPSMTQRKK